MKAWTRPSHNTLTKPTNRSPSRAMTHPRLYRLHCATQSHSDASNNRVSKASACSAWISAFVNAPRHEKVMLPSGIALRDSGTDAPPVEVDRSGRVGGPRLLAVPGGTKLPA